MRALERALAHARLAHEPREEAEILMWLASGLFWGSTPAGEAARRCHAILAESSAHPVVEAAVLTMLGGLLALGGRFEEARDLYGRGKALTLELGQQAGPAAGRPSPL